ncbi:group 10 secretory phospholipase A2 isoform X2 [Nyctibius grandis]|uniref:group 10 secretory phospholipase A2 isoform X2 n=1 Tax=Nyctibius grandis TaxID=48427 RepID=UPI0035BBC3D6
MKEDSHQSFPSTVYKGTFGEAHFRNRRGILELAGAIRCTTGRSPFAYLRYGCYCGLGGRGWPKDRVDCLEKRADKNHPDYVTINHHSMNKGKPISVTLRCCFNHDCCYGKAEQAGCHPKTETFHWECEDNAVVCESLEDKCQKMACECDREAAKCFSKAPYHTKYLLWPDVMCGEIQPFCRY